MMGRLEAQENLFYRFRIEDHVPKDHLLRKIDWLLDFDVIRHELADLYSHTGRPSIDPELMLRMLLVGYLYGIRSERRLVAEAHLNLAYRWFCKLGLEGRVPDRSTFSKNRHGRFADGDVISETDPDAAWSLKDGPGRFSYETNYMIDTDHGIIMDVEATPARLSQEIVAAKTMLERSAKRHDFQPDRIAADGSYGTGPFLTWLLNREVTPHIPVLDRKHQTNGKYDLSHFQYDVDRDSFTCLEGHELTLRSADENTRVKRYRSSAKICGACSIRDACTDAPVRTVTRHMDEEARQTVRDLRHTAAYEVSRLRRKKVEMLFAHLKRHLGFRRLRLRGLKGANEEFLLAATAQNLKRLAEMVPT